MNKFPRGYFLIISDFNLPCMKWIEEGGFSFTHSSPRAVLDVAISIMVKFTFRGQIQYNHKLISGVTLWICVLAICQFQ